VRAVLDPNILIAGLLSPKGAPAQIVSRWLNGEFELVVSELLLAELERALTYPKLRTRVGLEEAAAFFALLRSRALIRPDPGPAPRRSADRGDDYLLALAESERAALVSGDRHLLDLAGDFPIQTARAWVKALETRP
jgi:putative PIN family toxin of toxin-antitoxin system